MSIDPVKVRDSARAAAGQSEVISSGSSVNLGVGAALVNGFTGMWRDSIQYRRQKELNKENNQFNAIEAAKQRSAAAAAQQEQQRYNSEQAQVSRLKQAGLNPALLYGGATSSSSVSSQSAASASPSSFNPSGQQFDFSGVPRLALDSQLQAAQIRNLDKNTENQNEDVTTKSIQNKYVDAKTQGDLLEQIARINELTSRSDLNDETRNNLIKVRDATIAQMYANAKNALSNAEFTAGAKTDLTNAQSNLATEQANTEESKRRVNNTTANLNVAKTETEGTIQRLNSERVDTEVTQQILNNANARLAHINADEIERKYNIDKAESDAIDKWLEDHGFSKAWTKSVLEAWGEFRKGVGKGLSEFFSGSNWLNFIAQQNRTSSWSRPQQGSDESPVQQTPQAPQQPQTQPSNEPQDVVKTVPSDENFNKKLRELGKDTPQEFKDEFEKSRGYLYNKLMKHNLYKEFKKDIYYCKDSEEFMQKYYEWYYKVKDYD